MRMVYRGYPLSWQTDAERDIRKIREEQEYFKGLYPQTVKKYQGIVDAECDRHDFPKSFIYDEYPDRETLFLVRDRIMHEGTKKGMEEERDMTYVLLLNEMERRRALKNARL